MFAGVHLRGTADRELPGIQRKKPKGRWLIEAEALSRWVRGQ